MIGSMPTPTVPMPRSPFLRAAAIASIAVAAACAPPGGHPPDASRAHAGHAAHGAPGAPDARRPVDIPEPLRGHLLANMRDHLQAIGEIQGLLAGGAYDRAAELAEARLGLSSLRAHGAHDVAKHMPQGMQDAGTAMHRSASRFARVATDASATGDPRAPLEALSVVTGTCVACHAGYRLK